MTRYRHVEGNINESTGGSHKIFSDEKIVTQSYSYIAQRGEEKGVSFKEPQKAPKFEEIYSLAIDLAWLSMDVLYRDEELLMGVKFKRTQKAHTFTLVGIKKNTMYGFRCYNFKFEMHGTDFYAVVFMGTRPNNLGSLTDNITQALRLSEQVEWSRQLGIDARYYKNVIFAGHSKGGREAAHAAIEHGSGTVYSYNTSIAYLDSQSKVKEYISKGGVMHHFTVPGELLMMNKANGWNAGFQPTILDADDVKMRTHTFNVLRRLSVLPQPFYKKTTRESYYSREDAKRIGLTEQVARHSDYKLMENGLTKGGIMSPGTMRYVW